MVLPSATFQSVSLYDKPFWDKSTEWNNWPLQYICLTTVLVTPNSVSFALWPTFLRPLTSAPNDRKMTLNTRLKAPHMCLAGIPYFSLFCYTTTHFKLQSLYGKCTEWHQNDLVRNKVKAKLIFELEATLRYGHWMTNKVKLTPY